MRSRRGHGLLRLIVLTPVCLGALAGNAKPVEPVTDAELLEFLGGVDSGADSQAAADDGSWIEYLSQTDIGKVAKTAGPNGSGAKQAAAGAQPPASGVKKNE
jgi:hypothetical protein